MKQITVNKHNNQRKPNQFSFLPHVVLDGSEVKNSLQTNNNSSISTTDMMGLSWIFSKEEDYF